MLGIWFLLAVVAGFVFTLFSMIEDKDTNFIIFDSEEELQQACWNGLRKGVK